MEVLEPRYRIFIWLPVRAKTIPPKGETISKPITMRLKAK
jgi:hypothetical protein